MRKAQEKGGVSRNGVLQISFQRGVAFYGNGLPRPLLGQLGT
jgi:hypothetical protein